MASQLDADDKQQTLDWAAARQAWDQHVEALDTDALLSSVDRMDYGPPARSGGLSFQDRAVDDFATERRSPAPPKPAQLATEKRSR